MPSQNKILFWTVAGLAALYVWVRVNAPEMLFGGALVPTRSAIDGQMYLVLDKPDKQQAADLLAKVHRDGRKLVDKLQSQTDSVPKELQPGIDQLIARFDTTILEELDSSVNQSVAYNQGKGELIALCLRNGNRIADQDVVMSVYVHEMAHICASKFGVQDSEGFTVHDQEFKTYERFLGKVASSLGIYSPSAVIGRRYCQITIPNPATAQ